MEIELRPEEFEPTLPGRTVKAVQGHWTFVPDALPPQLSYDGQLVSILSEAERALGELAGVGRMLPNPHLLIRPFISREGSARSPAGSGTAFIAPTKSSTCSTFRCPNFRPKTPTNR